MFRLTREVRFAINPQDAVGDSRHAVNGFAGAPALRGIGHFFSLEVTLLGDVAPETGCVRDIKEIDRAVRERAVPVVEAFVHRGRFAGGGLLALRVLDAVDDAWPGATVHHLRLSLSPFITLTVFAEEAPMVRISQKFEFSASHRLHNDALSDEENMRRFGKCNNPHGHGHNYVVQVTLAGKPDDNGLIVPIPDFEHIVHQTVIEPFDHKNLNVELPQFSKLIPTVENIAMVIYKLLKPKFSGRAQLAGVTVWETTKTSCEYME